MNENRIRSNDVRVEIRRLAPFEAAVYREIRLEALRLSPEAFGSTFEAESARPLEQFAERLSNCAVFGAFLGAEIMGMAGFMPREGAKDAHKGFLWGMYVRAGSRSAGVGRRLAEVVIAFARERVELLQLAVVSGNEPARTLYASLGFLEYGIERKALKHNGRYDDEVLMVKDLTPESKKDSSQTAERLRGIPGLPTIGRVKEFIPLGLLRNPHAMTIAAAFWPRPVPLLVRSKPRLFEVEDGTQVRGECHWQENPREHPTLVLLHGLEGSCESKYMVGTAEKAWVGGFNVVRLNQRNCGGTEKLTSSLYHSGLSCDIRAVVLELIERDGLLEIFAGGFSMGGNLVLKMAGDMGLSAPPELRGVAAVAPALDLASCADALAAPSNFIYEHHFVTRLKRRMRYKASLFPELYELQDPAGFQRIRTVRDFDDIVTARYCGFEDASDYYARSSAARVIAEIRVPTLIITAKDDPFVPFEPFQKPTFRDNPLITLVATEHGGHCAFISREDGDERFWAEARIVEYCKSQSQIGRKVKEPNRESVETEEKSAC